MFVELLDKDEYFLRCAFCNSRLGPSVYDVMSLENEIIECPICDYKIKIISVTKPGNRYSLEYEVLNTNQ